MPTLVKGCCPLDCQDSCAWTARAADGEVLGVDGAKDHPITRGVLCAKVRDYEARLTAPDRLLAPLRRVGVKGEGRFEPITWDAALSTIAGRFREIIAVDGAEALMPFHYLGSMGVVQRFAPMRIFHALGASQIHGGVCGVSASALLAEGHPIGVDPEETEDAELVLLWGQNTLSTAHHQWQFVEEARRKRGAQVFAIDPRLTRTAKKCDRHLAIRPGSDAVLAAAMARHLFVTGRADLELASLWVEDLDAYREAVMPWTAERAADATGLAAEDIGEVAELFASAKPAQIRAGIAPQQTAAGEAFVRGLSALAILGGHWRHRGGGLSILSMPALEEVAAGAPQLMKGSPRSLDMAKLGEILTGALLPPIKGLMVWSANPAVTQIDSLTVRAGLQREDLFTVVADHFLTDTARYADIVLPATTQFEHFDIQGAWGHHYVSANLPAVPPRGEARSSGAIMRGLARHLGLEGPRFAASDEEIAADALPPGWSLEELKRTGWRKSPTPRPETAPLARKLKLAGGPLAAPPAPPLGTLQLLTPKSHYFLNSTFANMPRQRQSQGPPAVEMHPDDAKAFGLDDGSQIALSHGGGRITAALRISADVRRGNASFEGKWWSAPPGTAAAMNDVTLPRWSSAGQPAYNDTFVTVERA